MNSHKYNKHSCILVHTLAHMFTYTNFYTSKCVCVCVFVRVHYYKYILERGYEIFNTTQNTQHEDTHTQTQFFVHLHLFVSVCVNLN
jgi:hypothetical protein